MLQQIQTKYMIALRQGTDIRPEDLGAVRLAMRMALEELHLQYRHDLADMDDIIADLLQERDQLRATAAALGVVRAGAELVRRTEAQIAEARSLIPNLKTKPKVAFLYARGTGLMILGGPGSGASELIEFLGGIDAGTAAGLREPYTSLTAEGLIKAAPAVLLMMTDGLASVGGIDGLLRVPGVAQTPAGRTRSVIDMADGQLLTFGPRTGAVALALAKALYRS